MPSLGTPGGSSGETKEQGHMIARSIGLSFVVAAALAGSASAVMTTWNVECVGTESAGDGGPNGRQYCYKITLGDGFYMDQLLVGTWDTDPNNYTLWEAVDSLGNSLGGWTWGLDTLSQEGWTGHTPHEQFSPGPNTTTPAVMYWTSGSEITDGIFYFGVDNPHSPWDTGFHLEDSLALGLDEMWTERVSNGAGPVHGPMVPEPATLTLLALGTLTALRRRR